MRYNSIIVIRSLPLSRDIKVKKIVDTLIENNFEVTLLIWEHDDIIKKLCFKQEIKYFVFPPLTSFWKFSTHFLFTGLVRCL